MMICKRLITALIFAGLTIPAAFGQAADAEEDFGAQTFLQSCIRCHAGILTGNDLQNTRIGTTASLESSVRRMQVHTGPLSEKQVGALVDLLHHDEVTFRLEDAKLSNMADRPDAVAGAVQPPDLYAELFVRSCAGCHTVGGGTSMGGDLTHVKGWAVQKLKPEVARMQARVGPLTNEQIDGLVALLKDDKVSDRLAAAGYKSKVVETPVPAPSQQVGNTSPQTHTAPQTTANAGSAKHAAEGESAHGESQSPPYATIGISCIVAALLGLGAFKISTHVERDTDQA